MAEEEEEEEEFLARLGTGYANLFKQAYRRRYNISVGITRVRYMSVLGNRSNYLWSIRPCLGS